MNTTEDNLHGRCPQWKMTRIAGNMLATLLTFLCHLQKNYRFSPVLSQPHKVSQYKPEPATLKTFIPTLVLSCVKVLQIFSDNLPPNCLQT